MIVQGEDPRSEMMVLRMRGKPRGGAYVPSLFVVIDIEWSPASAMR
jgi:hypothetical protein